MGSVYEARHRGTGRRVAVKVISGGALERGAGDMIRRFEREAMATGAIESQYIAHALDTGVDPASGAPYLVMELLAGEDLQQTLRRVGPLMPDVALRVAAQACLGLQKAHEAGVVHRDIKPANLFLTRRERGEVIVKILDFGIAKVKMDQFSVAQSAEMTRTGLLLGSPMYMSPEQARGKKSIDHRTDLWSLGVVLYETLTGKTPYNAADTIGDMIVQICSEEPTPLRHHAPWVMPQVASIVERAMTRDLAKRFASAIEMFESIRALLRHGDALDESAFVPLPLEARREALASRPVGAPPAPGPDHAFPTGLGTPLTPSRTTPSVALSGAAPMNTAAAFSKSRAGSSRPPGRNAKVLVSVVVALCALAGLSVGVGIVAHRGAAALVPAPTAPQTPAAEVTNAPSSTTVGAASPTLNALAPPAMEATPATVASAASPLPVRIESSPTGPTAHPASAIESTATATGTPTASPLAKRPTGAPVPVLGVTPQPPSKKVAQPAAPASRPSANPRSDDDLYKP